MSIPPLSPDQTRLLHDGYQAQVRGLLDDAARQYRKILKSVPDHPDVMHLLAMVRSRQHRTDEAIALYRAAAALKPQDAKLWYNLGLAYTSVERNGEGADAFARALALDPSLPEGTGMLFSARRSVCDWRDDARLLAAIARAGDPAQPEIPPFFTLWLDDPALQLAAARRTVHRRCAGIAPKPLPAREPADGRVRIGYLSADFRNHPTTHLLVRLLEVHDRSKFEITAFSIGPNDASPARKRVEASVDRFIDCERDQPFETAERARRLGIHILVDVMGHTNGNRMEIFAGRAAPVQVSYLGYPGTSGADFMDYVIADPFVLPLEDARFFSEKVVHLPDTYQPNDPTLAVAARPGRAECGLPASGFVFCAFNNARKLDPATFALWMRLLARVPGSVLWLLAGDEARAHLRRAAEAAGVAPDRLIFAPHRPLPEHLARMALADLFLDTFPYTAHTTASDALRVGLPLVTRTGRSFASKVAGRLMQLSGLGDLVTDSVDAYEALALSLAGDPDRLSALRARLEDGAARERLFDIQRYRAQIEAAYLAMMDRAVAGAAPDHIAMAPTVAQGSGA
ncbi:tetratricopeptide repeat protein [Xanthobacter autotrophicus]|uniref:O-linked N-acetylglucosamine transferase, SPINDLY family protein n=1 Tax=Xanthobacter autotrophicus TaxID=280 RepID=UPI0024A6A2BA|nr:tetratricopeptide repeat protein [Xanthobacter autotrophicus]MDI4659103.1 tetratricopeptide repeat protein [Xanthobacter autotrophicus]